MRAVVQRVTKASVSVNNEVISSIGNGLCVLIGISRDDSHKDIEYICRKILNTKLFSDGVGRWKKSVKDVNLEILSVSQFTLYSIFKGNKLDFHHAMAPDKSREFYQCFLEHLKSSYNADKVKDGAFGEYMQVDIQNDGPVTIEIDSQPSSASSGS